MLPNEVFALECIARYAREGLVRDSTWEFAHCPYPNGMGDGGYYLTFYDHQKQGLLQSVDLDRRCFFTGDVQHWLDTKPPGYEELYVIFKHYISGEHCPIKGRMGELHPCYGSRTKPVMVIKPDGTKLHFGSGSEAARELGIDSGNLSKLLNTDKQPKRGKFEGWQFFYAAKSNKKAGVFAGLSVSIAQPTK